MKLTIYNGKLVSTYSILPHEREILLSPNMKFIVTKECYFEC
jgi:hypothetical protein